METIIYYTDFSGCGPDVLENKELTAALAGRLSDGRREKILACRNDRARLQSLTAGLLLDFGLRKYGLREKTAHFYYGKSGKPGLSDTPGLHFNLSHSGTAVMAAFSGWEIGCDIQEMVRMNVSRTAERFFSKEESDYVNAVSDEQERAEAFCRLWTLKESYVKALGTGLGTKLDSFCVLSGKRPFGYIFREYRVKNCCAAVCARLDERSGGAELPELVFCPFQNFLDVV